jgi:hypothetical protein
VINTPNTVRADEAHLLYEVLRDEKKEDPGDRYSPFGSR